MGRRERFVRQLRIADIGLGALYFFASHMVIRSMFYVGAGRDPFEVSVFLLVVLGSVALVHAVPGAFLHLRILASEYVKVPIVSALAMLGALLGLVSIVPATGGVPFFGCALLVGLSCGLLVVIWMSSFRVGAPDRLTFVLPPDLLCAVGFYFAFRFASTFSDGIAEGLLLALPLVAIACMLVDDDGQEGRAAHDDRAVEGRRASLVLVCVSAAFALLSAIVVCAAGKDDMYLSSGVNYMVLFEVLEVACVLVCCYLLHWFSMQPRMPRGAGAFVACVLCVPSFCIGLAMGAAYDPADVASLMWEVSFWVMLVAVFAYDLRSTLYLGEGLAVGLMFESMCMAQVAAQLVLHVGEGTWVAAVALAFALAYLVGVFAQLLRAGGKATLLTAGPDDCDPGNWGRVEPPRARGDAAACGVDGAHENTVACRAGALELAGAGEAGATDVRIADVPEDDLVATCRVLGRSWGLTASEERILVQLGRGRSARYIADDLGVSFNTVRTHIRHVYEKLGIHSKQELIDLVEAPRG